MAKKSWFGSRFKQPGHRGGPLSGSDKPYAGNPRAAPALPQDRSPVKHEPPTLAVSFMLEALRGREHIIDHEAHSFTSVTHILSISSFSLLPQSLPSVSSLSLFPLFPQSTSHSRPSVHLSHSLPSFSSFTLFPRLIHLSCSCVIVTLSSNNSQVKVSLQNHLTCALSHRSLLSAAITQSVISKSTGWSVDSAKPAGCHQATIFSNVKSLHCKGELAQRPQTTRRRA